MRAFEQSHPGVRVDIRRYDDTVAGVADGRAHVGSCPGIPMTRACAPCCSPKNHAWPHSPPDHRLADRDEVLLRDLADDPVIINVVSGTTSLGLWPPDRRPGTVVPVRNVDEWMEAIAAGRGIGLTPGRHYSHPAIRYRLITDAPRVAITLAWPRVAPHPLIADFVAVANRTSQARTEPRPGPADG